MAIEAALSREGWNESVQMGRMGHDGKAYSSSPLVGNVEGNQSTEETSSLKGRHDVADNVGCSFLVFGKAKGLLKLGHNLERWVNSILLNLKTSNTASIRSTSKSRV
tara:strand:- start:205 stop:525 length:321 start_codon:yes stop_codon:yes gene_type:complete